MTAFLEPHFENYGGEHCEGRVGCGRGRGQFLEVLPRRQRSPASALNAGKAPPSACVGGPSFEYMALLGWETEWTWGWSSEFTFCRPGFREARR